MKNVQYWLCNRSVQVILTSGLYLILSPYLPENAPAAFYTISLLIKDILLWMLPVTVCLFIAHAIASFEKSAILFVVILFLFEAFSNTCSIWYAYLSGYLCHDGVSSIQHSFLNQDTFSYLWRFPFARPPWWTADKGSFVGMLLGIASASKSSPLKSFLSFSKEVAEKILTSFFAKLIPLFILGFIARMQSSHLLNQIYSQYGLLLIEMVLMLMLYVGFLFLLGGGNNTPSFTQRIKNLIPAATMAFSSGCSLSTMPWTIEGTSKNIKDPTLAKAVIPATTNIQQIGDCIINSFLCFLIYEQFYGHPPDLWTWASFSVVFMLARFATAAVIGGAIFIMLPIYETYLYFTPEMIAIILAFNVILDPLVTCANVIANGALCRIFERVWEAIKNTIPSQRLFSENPLK